jgi:HlyD family secretion protein
MNKVIPESEIEKSYQALIRINIELQQVRLDYSEKSIELAEKKQLLQDYKIKGVEEEQKIVALLNESFLNLKAQLDIWDNNYLLRSPFDGVVTFTQFWNENQVVMKDEPVLNVIPHNTGSYVGRVSLKMQRSGKVKPGQQVNIKLSSFPYLEYGMVRGIVRTKSLVPSIDAYIIEIDLPDGLTTLYGRKLEFTQNMSGTAEILTEDLRLLQKLINPLKYLITKNQR